MEFADGKILADIKDGVGTVVFNQPEKRNAMSIPMWDGMAAALEPEPGMLVETLDDWAALQTRLPGLRLALDLGHCLVTHEREPAAAVIEFAPHIGTVAIEDMRAGEHTHLPFGEGDMDIPACLDALETIGFAGLVCVELSRESHRAHSMVPDALAWLRACR